MVICKLKNIISDSEGASDLPPSPCSRAQAKHGMEEGGAEEKGEEESK